MELQCCRDSVLHYSVVGIRLWNYGFFRDSVVGLQCRMDSVVELQCCRDSDVGLKY